MKNKSKPPKFKAENRDIQRYIALQYIKRAVGTVLYLALVLFLAFRAFANDDPKIALIVTSTVVFVAAAFFIFGWHKILKEENAVGTLVRKGFRYETELPRGVLSKGEASAYGKASLEGAEGSSLRKDIVYFFIETPDGKQIRKRYYDDGKMSFLFFDGDTVCLRRGLKYPQNLSAVHQEAYLCVVCGNTVSDKTDICPRCRHSIIKLDSHVPRSDEDTDEEYEE